MSKKTEIGGQSPTNEGKYTIDFCVPYTLRITIQGNSDILFHRWSNEDVAEKSAAAKGSKAKKTDNVESFVYRDEKNNLCVPGEYLRQSIISAAKFKQDPRSPRKSAMDLYKAAIIPLTNLCSFGVKNWDYEDRRRVVIQKNAITRTRPALKKGWSISCDFLINLPEYISESDFLDTCAMAGKLIGIGNFRPTFGRFQITKIEKID